MRVAIDKLSDVLHSSPHFRCLLDLCTNKDAYLVGGAIRDALIGRPLSDLDLIMPEDPTALANDFARHIGGHWFWLDKERRQSRVVVNHGDNCLIYDFALFRAPDLKRDLLDRDFTINALALPLTGDLSGSALFDPCRGVEDLHLDSLRMVSEVSLRNDPLRIVKGVRHATVLGLEIDCGTLSAMQAEIAGLGRIAPERIRQEVWKIFADVHAARGLQLLHESRAGQQLFGERFDRSIPELIVNLKSCRNKWQYLVDCNPVVSDWLATEIEQGLSNETLLLYTILLASIEPELPGSLAENWLLSRKARTNIAAIVALDKVARNDFAIIARNERAYAWWAARQHIEPKLLLLALAAVGSPESRPSPAELRAWVPLVANIDDRRPNDLVDGHWLRNKLHLKDGPEMTRVLELLRNSEISGQVSSEEEARLFLLEHYQNKD
ncbi:MAG: CCA tRNA nucleotidyltransferase [Desulfuromonadales bacterium]|nr:CCA tRNA nucleotidyltransferase [Desulfuromonadales bacterium]